MNSDDYVAPPDTISSWADCLAHSKALWHYVFSMDESLEKHKKRIEELEAKVSALRIDKEEVMIELLSDVEGMFPPGFLESLQPAVERMVKDDKQREE